jgi:hypothetical protein
MNYRRIVIAAPALVLTTLAFGGVSAATAGVPEETDQRTSVVPRDPPVGAYNYPEYDVNPVMAPEQEKIRVMVPVDDTTAEALQAGASALGGAALAFGTLWFYRRRYPLAG